MNPVNQFVVETYKIHGEEEFIGEGSFGNVYKFKNKRGKVFAVKKILQHRLQDNISHEKDLLELVCHKHIIRYYSSYYEGPVLCIVMEYADKYINKHFYLVDTRPSYNEIVNSKRGK